MRRQILFALAVLCASSRSALGFDLEMTLRFYPTHVKYGDPVYIETTIMNVGKNVVVAPTRDTLFGSFYFRFSDMEKGVYTTNSQGGGLVGGQGKVEYLPGESVRHYSKLFLPPLEALDRDFWLPFENGQPIGITAHYKIEKTLTLNSTNGERTVISSRDEREMRHLRSWANRKVETDGVGPSPGNFDVGFLRPLDREQLVAVLAPMGPSELADNIQLTIRMQEIWELPPELRAENERLLVEWLKKQHEIKRKTLTREVRTIAKAYSLESTIAVMDALIEEEEEEDDEEKE